MEEVSLFVAFMAGFASFISPCVLPLVPAYIGYITGSAVDRSKIFVLVRAVGFVIGFGIIFVLLGASASYLGQLFAQYRDWFTRISGIIIIIFGLHLAGIVKISLFYRQLRVSEPTEAKNIFGSTVMGMAFAAGWTPCVGPVLASILLYAGTVDTVTRGILLLVAYSVGLGVPFILTALFINQFSTISNNLNKHLPLISKISGWIMIVFGILMFLNLIERIAFYFYY